jgi:hypothetical protein
VEVIIAIVVVGGLIWFGLAILGNRKDENGMDAQDRHYHRKAIGHQGEEDAAPPKSRRRRLHTVKLA